MTEIWSYLAHAPLLWLTMTLAAYVLGVALFHAAHDNPAANPALIAMILLALLLHVTGTPFATYFEGAQFVHFLLGPATVCLALPLYDNLPKVRRALLPLLCALAVGALVGILTALGIARGFGSVLALFLILAAALAIAA